MPLWLAQNPLGAYFFCAAIALIFFVCFWSSRQTKHLGGVAVAVLLALVVFLIDWSIETDMEQIDRKLQEMAQAAERGELDKLRACFAPSFQSEQFGNLDRLMKDAATYLTPNGQRQISLWAPELGFQGKQRLTCICQYSAQGMFGSRELPPRLGKLELQYVKGADGQWRIESFHLLNLHGQRQGIIR